MPLVQYHKKGMKQKLQQIKRCTRERQQINISKIYATIYTGGGGGADKLYCLFFFLQIIKQFRKNNQHFSWD
jgi:hypothetical protein